MIGLYLAGGIGTNDNNLIKYFLQEIPQFITNDKIILIDKYRNNMYKDIVNYDYIKINYEEIINKSNSWNEITDYIKEFLKENHINKLLFFRFFLEPGYTDNNYHKAVKFLKNDMNSLSGISYNEKKRKLIISSAKCSTCFAKAASEVCDSIYQYITDPLELKLNKIFDIKDYHVMYFLKGNKCCTFVPYYTYGIAHDDSIIKNNDKTNLFSFYATALKGTNKDSRKKLRLQKEELENNCSLDIHIIANKNKDKILVQEDYFKLLSKTKYTCIIPPYRKESFSMMRFTEAIVCSCVPFVFKSCNLEEVKNTFPDLYEIIIKYLLIDDFYDCENKIKSISENDRIKLISLLQNTQSIKNITDFDYCSKKWNSIIQKKTNLNKKNNYN